MQSFNLPPHDRETSTSHYDTSPISENRSGGHPREMVLALCAPTLNKEIKTFSINWAKIKNLDRIGSGTAVAIYKVTQLSDGCCNLLKSAKLMLSGCAVVSKGVVVVEGGTSFIRKLMIFMVKRAKEKAGSPVEVIWIGKVERPVFGKFSILHCNNDLAAWNFFAHHRASHYWDIAVRSTLN